MKKYFSFLFVLLISFVQLFALPGFTSLLKDQSGEFVYYKDSTFNRESYVGILSYDEKTFQLRYVAPKDDSTFTPAKEICLLLTIDPAADHIILTGERIISTVVPNTDDTDIVNYLHDIFYEFCNRRKQVFNVNGFGSKATKVIQEYPQFGGKVTITFDALVPLFNIKSISDPKGNTVLSCVTFGCILSEKDTTFSNFQGFPKISENKMSSAYPKEKSMKIEFADQTITADENWTQKMENLWTLGNDSIITISELPEVETEKADYYSAYFVKKLLLSSSENVTDFSNTEIHTDSKNGKIKIINKKYLQEKNKYTYEVKILSKGTVLSNVKGFELADKFKYKYFSMTTYLDAYNSNPSYFDKIVKSLK